MNAPTIIIGLIILAVFAAIVGKGITTAAMARAPAPAGAPAAEGAATAPRPGCATLRSNRRHAGARLAPLSKE